jgi:tRNA 2-thiouridine synthesizing protein A
MADKVLDAKGLNCPLPILKAKKALKDVPDGGTLEILATDPGSVADFEALNDRKRARRTQRGGRRLSLPAPQNRLTRN